MLMYNIFINLVNSESVIMAKSIKDNKSQFIKLFNFITQIKQSRILVKKAQFLSFKDKIHA